MCADAAVTVLRIVLEPLPSRPSAAKVGTLVHPAATYKVSFKILGKLMQGR